MLIRTWEEHDYGGFDHDCEHDISTEHDHDNDPDIPTRHDIPLLVAQYLHYVGCRGCVDPPSTYER